MTKYVRSHIRKSSSERRREILEATLRIISEYGVEGATISRIAAAVGLTPGALYRHFPSRAALISEANKVANERALDWVKTSGAPDALQRLQEIGSAHLAWLRDNFMTVVRPFFLELALSSHTDPEARLKYSDFKSFRAVVEIAEEGRRQGVIRADVDPRDVAWALHMFAWAQDIALMAGAEEAVTDGTLERNLKRLLEAFRADESRGQ